ncbi:PREDICTED: uncharacterized protein LOC106550789, partial [Thamnophis sirtalis]|uniref:Uncharacterized protein LOC106550789 n=1 Tax=Thamnophis sirtalis TaxID=35019 RepID=A0A6I9YKF9_9SAUR
MLVYGQNAVATQKQVQGCFAPARRLRLSPLLLWPTSAASPCRNSAISLLQPAQAALCAPFLVPPSTADFQPYHELPGCSLAGKVHPGGRTAPGRPALGYGTNFPTNVRRPLSICPSSFSFTQIDHKASPKLEKKEPKRRDWQEPCDSSPSLVDLMHSLRQYDEEDPMAYLAPNTSHHHRHHNHHKTKKGDAQEMLQDLTEKRYEDMIPEREKKLAALML